MLKKILFSSLVATTLTMAASLDTNFTEEQLNSNKWQILYEKDKTALLMLPMDVEFSNIQKTLSDGDSLSIYKNENTTSISEVVYGTSFVTYIVLKNNESYYWVKDSSGWHKLLTYSELKEHLETNVLPNVKSEMKTTFEKFYVPYFEKIKANGLYKIKPKNNNLTVTVNIPSGSISDGANDGNTSDGNTSIIALPPSPPAIQ